MSDLLFASYLYLSNFNLRVLIDIFTVTEAVIYMHSVLKLLSIYCIQEATTFIKVKHFAPFLIHFLNDFGARN